MNTTFKNILRGTAIAAAVFASLSSQAATGQDTYNRVVLGGTPVASAADSGTRLVPGSYARYLTHNGMPLEQALAQAQASGETARLEATKVAAPVRLSSQQVYQRVEGISSF